MNKKQQPKNKPVQQEPPKPVYYEDEDDFFIDESLVNLFKILLPKLKFIVALSAFLALMVGLYIYLSPRQFECTAIVAPDVMRDYTSVDLVQMSSGDSDISQLPFASQLSQLQTLAKSSQVKQAILEENQLYQRWECETIRECIQMINSVYNVREIRNVGLELSAEHEDEQLVEDIVKSAIENTNQHFENIMRQKAEKSIDRISSWVNDVTQEIQKVSNEFIEFASSHNISNLQSQFSAGSSLVATLKENITLKEAELAQKSERFGVKTAEIRELQASIKTLKSALRKLLMGEAPEVSDNPSVETIAQETMMPVQDNVDVNFDENIDVYPPLDRYQELKLKIEDYENELSMLRSRADLFSKQLAAAQIESQRQARSIMQLDEPFVSPVSKGTIKFTILTFIGLFFFLCIAVIMKEYFSKLLQMIKEK